MLVSEAIRPLLNTFPTTRSKDSTWGLSVSGVLKFECEEDLRGVFVVALSVNDKRGEALVVREEIDFPFSDELVDSLLMKIEFFQLS